jgi:hypothetical protein
MNWYLADELHIVLRVTKETENYNANMLLRVNSRFHAPDSSGTASLDFLYARKQIFTRRSLKKFSSPHMGKNFR